MSVMLTNLEGRLLKRSPDRSQSLLSDLPRACLGAF